MAIFDYVRLIMSGIYNKFMREKVKSEVEREINFLLKEGLILSNEIESQEKVLIFESVVKSNPRKINDSLDS